MLPAVALAGLLAMITWLSNGRVISWPQLTDFLGSVTATLAVAAVSGLVVAVWRARALVGTRSHSSKTTVVGSSTVES